MSLTLAYLMWLIELYRNSGNFRWYKILSKKTFDASNFRCFNNRRKFIMLPLTAIPLVRAAAARNASPSMEKPVSISQLLPLPTDFWHA